MKFHIRMIAAGVGAVIIGIVLTIDSFEKPEPGMPTLPQWHGPALIVVGIATFFLRLCLLELKGGERAGSQSREDEENLDQIADSDKGQTGSGAD